MNKNYNEQVWKFYIAIPLWLLYFFLLPYIYTTSKFIFIILSFTLGNYLFFWLGYLYHETWHEYVKVLPNKKLYYLYGILLFSDPQLYRLVHGSHHANVHTYQDLEFYPLGKIRNKKLRSLYNILEIFFGVAVLTLTQSITLPKNSDFNKKFSKTSHIIALSRIIGLYGAILLTTHIAFSISIINILVCYLISIWIHSFSLHQSQLIEHGFLIAKGTLKERSLLTRNIKPHGAANIFLLFLTHNDTREHVLHHTLPSIYSRPYPGKIQVPKEVNLIDFKYHLRSIFLGMKGETLER